MTKKKTMKIETPILPAELPIQPKPDLTVQDFVEMGIIQDCSFDERDIDRVTFEKIIFRNVTFADTSWARMELTDVIFEKCDFSNADWTDAVLHRTEFRDCKMIGMQLTGATIRNVLIDNALADYASLRVSNTKQFIIQDSSLSRADFCFAKLQKTELSRCNIDRAQFSGTPLSGMDLSDCEFNGLSVNIEDLKGCMISREQAYVFAALFGLIVNE
ncbi:pentapeptide repeat-containing protein [Paenibacillus sp. NPDC057967]|uniref:pentapeptide repeat-containing protein n=1 Tax=Paenibacillus sp. NPDC057967 TaxID=3346293 RepID=UPI0036DE4E89